MKRSIAPWTTALTAAAALALPIAGSAQTPQTPPEPQPSQSTTLSKPTAQTNASAADHLREAKAALSSIDVSAVPARAKTQFAALNRHINALERSIAANDNASTTATTRRSPKSTRNARGNVNWATEVAAIDSIITQLAGSASTAATGEPATAGTTGTEPRPTTKAKTATAVTLDEPSRSKLMEVRTHITQFAAAMSGTSSSSTTAASSSAQPASATPGSTTAAPSETATPPTPTGAQPTTPPGQTDTTSAAQSKVNADAAKQHLTAARDSLTQLTQLPAAAQLQGEARTQVSQLIQNFNELITAQADWRANYAKVEANLNALIGAAPSTETSATTPPTTAPEVTPTTPPATPPSNPPATTPGTPGAVGTTGTTSNTPTLDPAIRQKLVDFRTHLLAFHTAAGGGEPK